MHLEEFAKGDSFFHTVDERVKFLVFVPLTFTVALTKDISIMVFFFLLSILFIRWSKAPLREVFRRLVVVNLFILFLWFTLPFSLGEKVLFTFFGLKAKEEGILLTTTITLRANTILLFTISILATSSIVSLGHALYHLRFPKKIIWLFFFLYRYISVVHNEYNRLFWAAKLRGFLPTSNLFTYRTYASFLGMLFIRSYERAQRVYYALILRGFKGEVPLITHFRMRTKDIVFATGMFSAIIYVIIIQWMK